MQMVLFVIHDLRRHLFHTDRNTFFFDFVIYKRIYYGRIQTSHESGAFDENQ